jgi:hypothetical protein
MRFSGDALFDTKRRLRAESERGSRRISPLLGPSLKRRSISSGSPKPIPAGKSREFRPRVRSGDEWFEWGIAQKVWTRERCRTPSGRTGQGRPRARSPGAS